MQNKIQNKSISFIILALNEEAYIESTVNTVINAVSLSDITKYELILVNDGSTDSTQEIMQQIILNKTNCKVINNTTNIGIGGSWRIGLSHAKNDYIMLIAGDDIMPIEDICSILNKIGEADVILPYLTNKKLRSKGRRLGSWGYTRVINTIFNHKVKYYQGVLPKRNIVTELNIKSTSYAFQAEITIKLLRKGYSYIEVPINNTPRNEIKSVALQPKRLLAVLKSIITLALEIYNPFNKSK